MFEAKFRNAVLFKKIFETIKELVSEVNVDIKSDSMGIQAIDSSHVALIGLKINSDGFLHYRCDRDLTLGFSMNAISKVFKIAAPEDSITLQSRDGSSNLDIAFLDDKEQRASYFSIKLMTINYEQFGIPERNDDLATYIIMPSKELSSIIKTVLEFSDSITILTETNQMSFKVTIFNDS